MSNYHHFPKYFKKEISVVVWEAQEVLAFSYSFVFKRFFCGSAQQETINSCAPAQILLILNTQPPSFTNLNILFKCNLLKSLNAAKSHKDYGKGRESWQNMGTKFISMCIPSLILSSLDSGGTGKAHHKKPRSCAPPLCPAEAEEGHEWHKWSAAALLFSLGEQGRSGLESLAGHSKLCSFWVLPNLDLSHVKHSTASADNLLELNITFKKMKNAFFSVSQAGC